MEITYQDLGTSVFYKIKGKDKEEVEQYYYLYWNHNATSGNLFWIDEVTYTEAYFVSSRNRMQKALESIWFHRLCDDPFYKKNKGGVKKDVIDYATKELKSIQQEYFIDPTREQETETVYGRRL